MTSVVIHSGACGYSISARVEKQVDGKITVVIETNCEMVQKMAPEIAMLDRFAPLMGFLTNPVYQSAARHLKHPACPVPSGILKALEVESGMNVPKDVRILFEKA